jgi:hypothetical protein
VVSSENYTSAVLEERPRLFLFSAIVISCARRRVEGGVRVRGGVGLVVGVVVVIILIFVLLRVL